MGIGDRWLLAKVGWEELLRARGQGGAQEKLLTLGPDTPGFGSWHTYVFEGGLGQI